MYPELVDTVKPCVMSVADHCFSSGLDKYRQGKDSSEQYSLIFIVKTHSSERVCYSVISNRILPSSCRENTATAVSSKYIPFINTAAYSVFVCLE